MTSVARRAREASSTRIVFRALAASGFPRSKWPQLVVVLRLNEGECRVTSRDAFAAWLRANALDQKAIECARRSVGRDQALVWAEVDIPGLAHAGFSVVTRGA